MLYTHLPAHWIRQHLPSYKNIFAIQTKNYFGLPQKFYKKLWFLAQLSRKLIWWAYRIGRIPSSSSTLFKHLLLRNHWANQSQISYDGGTKVCSNGPGHMTKLAAMPIYGKNLKNLLLWNQKADDLETWYASSGARVLLSLLKWWPWVDLDIFYGKVKFGPLCFCMGKKVKQWIFQKLL